MAQKITAVQSPDAKTIYIYDQSTGVDLSAYDRKVEVYSDKDGTGVLLATIPFTGTTTVVSYDITEDMYRSFKLVYEGTPEVLPAYDNMTSKNFSLNLLNDEGKCKCVNGSCDKRFNGFIFMELSQEATLAGKSGLANTNIKKSYQWLNSQI